MDIAFVDSDDCIEPDYLEQLYQTAKKYHADVVNCGYRTVKEDGTTLTEVSVSPFETITDYGRTGIFVVWAKLFRTSFKKKHNIKFPENKLYEDVLFSLAAKYHTGCVKSISYIGYSYIQHSNSTMTSSTIQTAKLPAKELFAFCSYAQKLLKDNYPYFYKNPYIGLRHSKELPLYYRIAILIFTLTVRLHLLKPTAWLLTRI